MQLSDIASALSAKVIGDGGLEIGRIVHPADADGSGDLAVALTQEAQAHLAGTTAGAVLIPADRFAAGEGPGSDPLWRQRSHGDRHPDGAVRSRSRA